MKQRTVWVAFACTFSLIFLSAYLWYRQSAIPFNAERFKQARIEQDYDTLYRMRDSLEEYLELHRPTYIELVNLLGVPDMPDEPATIFCYYYLGKHGFPVSQDLFAWIIIERGKVIEMRYYGPY